MSSIDPNKGLPLPCNLTQHRIRDTFTKMKTATIPPIRIESVFRQEIEQSLGDGETMAALVENAVRTEVARRRDQSEFVRRGLAAIARSEADGDWIPAETVIAKLEAKVAAARERQKKLHQ